MKALASLVSLALGFSLAASMAHAQAIGGIIGAVPSQAPPAPGTRATITFGSAPPIAMRPVTGAPYSADEVSEQLQTLADGTHLSQRYVQRKIYRDVDGRTRVERPAFPPNAPNAPQPPTVIEITDPVAGYRYVLDTQNKVAHRQAMPELSQGGAVRGQVMGGGGGGRLTAPPLPPPPPPAPGEAAPRVAPAIVATDSVHLSMTPNGAPSSVPKFTSETLATQTIDGVLVEGRRSTMTYAVGTIGNDREIVTTNESWMSPDLGILVMSKSSDPRSGEHTFRLENLSRNPPDPALFTPPADYQIVDEKSDFRVNYR